MTDVQKAMLTIAKALQDDEGYYIGWQANIAMAVYDSLVNSGVEVSDCAHEACNDGAKRFIKLCFDVESPEERKQPY